MTCYAGLPAGIRGRNTRVYRVTDYRGREGRRRLYRELRRNRYALVGIVCSGEPVMAKWKWALALRLPAKVFVINENGDYFWLDRKHLEPIRRICAVARGPGGSGRGPYPGACVFLPVHFAVSATLCNGRPYPKSVSQRLNR